MLQVPTDKEGLVDKGLLALADFAGGMSLDPTEIDKERGVVIEEWRLRQGASWRILEKQAPVLYYKSRYAERIPIGTPEILRSFPAARLKDFYETWYRPDRMAVVVVGDIDPAAMVPKVRELFAPLKPARAAAAEPNHEVPAHAETFVNVAADAEAQASNVSVLHKRPQLSQGSAEDYRRDHVRQLMYQMLNLRFSEITQRPDAPFLGAGAGSQELAADTSATSLGARTTDGGIAKGLEALLRRGAPRPRVRVHRRRTRSREAVGAGQLRARVRGTREDGKPRLRARVRRQLSRQRADARHRLRVRAHQGAAARHHPGRSQRSRARAAGRHQPRRAGDLTREGRRHAALRGRPARRPGEGRDVHADAMDRDAEPHGTADQQAHRREGHRVEVHRRHRHDGAHAVQRRRGMAEAHRLQERPGAARRRGARRRLDGAGGRVSGNRPGGLARQPGRCGRPEAARDRQDSSRVALSGSARSSTCPRRACADPAGRRTWKPRSRCCT